MQKTHLLPLEEALSTLLEKIQTSSQTERVSITEALNRVAAEDITSSLSIPPFDNSAVDGYAFRIADMEKEGRLPVNMRIPAGAAPGKLEPGCAARIFTGAPTPAGADCVVMQESADIDSANEQSYVSYASEMNSQQNIRPAGQDFSKGQQLLRRGDVLRPQNIALLASAGIASIHVFKPLKVAILSTGDELAAPGETLKPGQIYNSNQALLSTLVRNFGFESLEVGIVADTLEATKQALLRAAQADIIVSSGGASVGEEDYIKAAIEEVGEIDFWRIAIKPGKPFMLGDVQGKPVLGLPGNPSAVLVTFLMLARPMLLKRQGCRAQTYRSLRLPVGFSVKSASIRREFQRVRLNERGQLIAHPNQSSGMMSSSCWAEGLAVIPENTQPTTGDLVEFIPFANLLQFPDTLLEIG
ncbi:hypothetical protein A3742_17045 [Oleiphilus sp. HI0071]|uniref:molybdopterin molybdotransferase MoeA n=3 Tax=unclassified Oleiphilus TaxID=2631174 RepID=UPI0007C3670E|nr:gephyrin-like molybdotransferase Glp [Oleiphilus sp. HI0079]KZY68223.1 hypothetical protein A3737_02595 [Oleiphilus sp. HI0065]KZY82251.1 hypothetical protein A3742_10340 [Oleiphilus sp. HI0071]KZZ06293.1 hypothetical protein A3744_00490 [Oleiphilus sp. HI0073]KZZ42959.1 hypothetical protein A3758_05150 [Oleiphilus sp. HI0118]KZZ53749.1 hypothetical protein A3760_09535 [Oleiphilus sp. HI0122]KZZ71439.1 hypothetical protein A3765_02205 [Oleiphilus sp. HI0130]KZZ77486.1 hypothetical protein